MKKMILGALALGLGLTALEANAQELRFGVKGGYGKSVVRVPKRMNISDVSSLYTFNAQAYLDLGLSDGFSFQTGLAVNGKGAKIGVVQSGVTLANYESNPIYLELPINAVAKIAIGDIFDKTNIIIGGGPYIGYGISGKQKVSGRVLNKSYSVDENIIFSNDDKPESGPNFYGEYKQFDFGLNALAGIEFHWVTFNVNYQYGAVNVNPGAAWGKDDRMKNRVLSASLGVIF